MRIKSFLLATALASAFAAAPVAIAQNAAPAISDDGIVPVDFWAAQLIISNVRMSPDGARVSMMVRPGLGLDPVLQVYNTDNLSEEPKRFGAANLEITDASWLDNKTMVVGFRGQVRERIRGFNDGTFKYTAATLDVEKGDFDEFTDGRIVTTLPLEKNKVLIQQSRSPRASSYYVVDTDRGSRNLVLKTNDDLFDIGFDDYGNPRTAMSVQLGGSAAVFEYLYRRPGEGGWSTIFEQSENSFETFDIEGFTDDPNVIYVSAHNGEDKVGLWTYDVTERAFKELVARRDDVDIVGVRKHSDRFNHPEEVVGVLHATDKYRTEWMDETEGRLFATLEASIDNAHQVRIIDRSRDGNSMVVYNSGPRDPGTYYLVRNGALQKLGSSNPFVSGENLASVEYIEYPARDGRKIPAYVTTPTRGEAPYPTIVLPHGGPFVQEVVGYDKWSQMLANLGYLVIQPQYRGSRGHGLDHYQSAFINGGQGGYAMQDDKDDGALYLVEQGLADPDRLAMFGWSYGGYAAVTAAARTPQIYQCAIAGASVPDTTQQVNYYKNQLRGSSGVEQRRMWVDSFNPIEHADEVNIPLMLIHGTSDQRTPLRGVKDYMKQLDRADVSYEYVELPRADHFFGSIGFENEMKAYTAMIDFLENDCGPDGL